MCTHNIIPTMMRLSKNLQGSTGSLTESALVTYRSHTRTAIQRQPEIDSKEMTYADLHGNSESASSNPAVIDKTARTNKKVPKTSTLARDDLNRTFSFSSGLGCTWVDLRRPKSLGMPTTVATRARAEIGTLTCLGQRYYCVMQFMECSELT